MQCLPPPFSLQRSEYIPSFNVLLFYTGSWRSGGEEEKPTDIDCRLLVVHPSLPCLWLEVAAGLNEHGRMNERKREKALSHSLECAIQTACCNLWCTEIGWLTLLQCPLPIFIIMTMAQGPNHVSSVPYKEEGKWENGKSRDGRKYKVFLYCQGLDDPKFFFTVSGDQKSGRKKEKFEYHYCL